MFSSPQIFTNPKENVLCKLFFFLFLTLSLFSLFSYIKPTNNTCSNLLFQRDSSCSTTLLILNTSLEQRHVKPMASMELHSESGKKKIKLKPSTPQETTISTQPSLSTFFSKPTLSKKRKYATPESHLPNEETSNTKSTSSKTPIQTTESSKMLDQVLIGTEKACNPFWTKYTKEVLKRLSFCRKTDPALDINLWNGSSKRLAANLWFMAMMKVSKQIQNKSSPKISLQSQPSLWPEIMEII